MTIKLCIGFLKINNVKNDRLLEKVDVYKWYKKW